MKQNNETCQREALTHFSTQQLDEMLQLEVQKNMPDEETILAITDILRQREAGQAERIDDEVRNVWEDFQATCAADQAEKATKKRLWVARAAIIALVAGTLVMTVPQAAGAQSIFEIVARWSANVFSFFNQDDTPEEYVFKTENSGLQQIYDAVTEAGITQPVVPMWVPDGCVLTELKATAWPSKTKIYAVLQSDDVEIALTYMCYKKNTPYEYSKDLTAVRVIELEGIPYYIIKNDGTFTATWTADRVECSVSSDCQENILEDMLDSIYFTEDY